MVKVRSGGVGIATGSVWRHVLANAGDGDEEWNIRQCFTKQLVGETRHRHPAAQALAVKRADHVVGEARGVWVSGHGGMVG
jgi:hypothetical protein